MGKHESKAIKLDDSKVECISTLKKEEQKAPYGYEIKEAKGSVVFKERTYRHESLEEKDGARSSDQKKLLEEASDTRLSPLSVSRAQRRVVERAIKGNHKAIDKLIEIYYNDIFYFVVKKVGRQEGEDVVQQAIVRIINDLHTLKDPDKIKPWIMSVVYRTCMDSIRKKMQMKSMIEGQETPDDFLSSRKENDPEVLPEFAVIDSEKRTLILKVIDTLPENYADCLRLYYYSGLSYEEIAGILGVGWNKIRNDLYRGRVLFKKHYETETGIVCKLSTSSAAAFSFLTQVFHADEAQMMTPGLASKLFAFAKEQTGLSSPPSPTTALTQSLSTAGGKFAASALLATAVIGGAGAYVASEKPQESKPAEVVVEQVQAPNEVAPVVLEETPINTVADMIGVTQAEQLEAFSLGGVGKEELQTFLTHIGASQERFATEYEYRYEMYTLYKQDKQLLIFKRENLETNTIEVKYQFDKAKELPLMIEVILMFS